MTVATQVAENRLITTIHDTRMAQHVLETLEGPRGHLSVAREHEEGSPLPEELGRLLQQVLQAVAKGATVTVTSMPEELTTVTAASLIGVSRPTLMKMISNGDLPAHKVGSHTRLKAADVFSFLKHRQTEQRAAFEALKELLDS